jgi:hypothetical protein
MSALTVAVNGCSHGELDVIYETLQHIEATQGVRCDLLLCCGDFEAIRDHVDLSCMNVPPKYRKMGSFASYLDGTRTAPVLTVFVGGNHEASNHLLERYHGGWLAPNIYFLGMAGVVVVNGVRIAGLSGIYNARDFDKGRYEAPPFSEQDLRSVYHVRQFDVMRLSLLASPLDVMLSHDWPRGIYKHGDFAQLFAWKSFLADERDEFGSPANMQLLHTLRPTYWFCGHMHVKFAAVVQHSAASSNAPAHSTHFLALDKVGPRKQFLQLLNVRAGAPPTAAAIRPARAQSAPPTQCFLSIDREWLAVLHATLPFFNNSARRVSMPPADVTTPLVAASRRLVDELIRDEELLVPPIFMPGAPSLVDLLLARLQAAAPPVPLAATGFSFGGVVEPDADDAAPDVNDKLNEKLENDEEIELPDEEEVEAPVSVSVASSSSSTSASASASASVGVAVATKKNVEEVELPDDEEVDD